MKYWIVCAVCLGFSTVISAEDDWYPSKYGEGDTLGAINNLSPGGVIKAAQLV
ncbi:MAG TPA: polyketide cyclase, partial [Gammaproteobacteria bacterium]|nr:polyketide cyclase [Gammaproteobacteria bacterium]